MGHSPALGLNKFFHLSKHEFLFICVRNPPVHLMSSKLFEKSNLFRKYSSRAMVLIENGDTRNKHTHIPSPPTNHLMQKTITPNIPVAAERSTGYTAITLSSN